MTGGDTVPVMMVGRSATRGFETEMWHSALDAATYPRGAPPLSAAKVGAAPAPKVDARRHSRPGGAEKPMGPYAPK